jgi:hypothetical protein
VVISGGKTVTTVFLVGTNQYLLELREKYPTYEQLSQAPTHELIRYHQKAKDDLIALANKQRRFDLDNQTPTIGIGQPILTKDILTPIYSILRQFKQESLLDTEMQFIISGQVPEGPDAKHILDRLHDLSNMYDVRAQYVPLTTENALTIAAGVDTHLDSFPPPITEQSAMGIFCMKQGVPQWTSRYGLRDGIRGGRFVYGDATPTHGSNRVFELYDLNQRHALKRSWDRQVRGVLTDHDLYAGHMIDALGATASLESKVLDQPVTAITTMPIEAEQKYSSG